MNHEGIMHNNALNNNFYLIGDSAYSLRPWLLTPYDNAGQASAEDAFNYMHSSCRITVECTFGEIDARWGIFWRSLKFKLVVHRYIIDACMRLHNYIVDYRNLHTDNEDDTSIFEREQLEFMRSNPEEIVGVFGNGTVGTDENVGRPSSLDLNFVGSAKALRNSIRDKISRLGLTRTSI